MTKISLREALELSTAWPLVYEFQTRAADGSLTGSCITGGLAAVIGVSGNPYTAPVLAYWPELDQKVAVPISMNMFVAHSPITVIFNYMVSKGWTRQDVIAWLDSIGVLGTQSESVEASRIGEVEK